MQRLTERGVKISEATSVRQEYWREAEIYPSTNNPLFPLTKAQVDMLELFRNS